MSIIKSFSVYDNNGKPGDMFYIQHNSSNFTIIDCCLNEESKDYILNEIKNKSGDKDIMRLISTHPDEDHICGIEYLDDKLNIRNFYCVKNDAIKSDASDSFKHYCKLRDDEKKHFYVYKGCKRQWLNDNDENDGKNYGSSEIDFLWPITKNEDYKDAINNANQGAEFNNISPIFIYQLSNGVRVMWMGDIKHEFLEKIKNCIEWPEVDILFAPHHGRRSGSVSADVLDKLKPYIIVVGDAPSEHLEYYSDYNTITQNSAGDITFKCNPGKVHIYVSNENYSVDYLLDDNLQKDTSLGIYIGSFDTKEQ